MLTAPCHNNLLGDCWVEVLRTYVAQLSGWPTSRERRNAFNIIRIVLSDALFWVTAMWNSTSPSSTWLRRHSSIRSLQSGCGFGFYCAVSWVTAECFCSICCVVLLRISTTGILLWVPLLRGCEQSYGQCPYYQYDDDTKPVWPTWAVGALFRGARCRIHINRVYVSTYNSPVIEAESGHLHYGHQWWELMCNRILRGWYVNTSRTPTKRLQWMTGVRSFDNSQPARDNAYSPTSLRPTRLIIVIIVITM
jgi:hypothetical protein